MSSAILDYVFGFLSAVRENKKIKKGIELNNNLPNEVKAKVERLKDLCSKGDTVAAYQLGIMYLDADGIGYSPKDGEKFLEMAARKDDFDANYALALFYRGHWSYQHVDAYKSMLKYMDASHCKTNDAKYMQVVNRAIQNDFGTKSTKKNGIKVWFKVDIPIK